VSAAPTLSVVTITYADAAGFQLTLESLRPLFSHPPDRGWEHVVIDAAPTSNRGPLSTLPPDWPLVCIERPPRGVPDAFNAALAVAAGSYLWFLNAGDGLREIGALARMIAALERDPSVDLIGGAAYLRRDGVPLYPQRPRHTLLANIVGRSWLCHQAVIYRRASLARIGSFSTEYLVAGDYDFHIRCYIAGFRARFTSDVLVDYDMGGGSNDVGLVFGEFKRAQRRHRRDLPSWVNCGNELLRAVEFGRMAAMRASAATGPGRRLRPIWAKLNRHLRSRGIASTR
jgi:GT2 family glycosyltransferase